MVEIRRRPDGGLPHIGLNTGQPERSMYAPGENTLDQAALIAAAFQRLIDQARALWPDVPEPEQAEQTHPRDPLRVDAHIGRPVSEIEA